MCSHAKRIQEEPQTNGGRTDGRTDGRGRADERPAVCPTWCFAPSARARPYASACLSEFGMWAKSYLLALPSLLLTFPPLLCNNFSAFRGEYVISEWLLVNKMRRPVGRLAGIIRSPISIHKCY